MTAYYLSYDFAMDGIHLDDKMEIGTSPYPHADDIDLDFDDLRQPSVDRSMADELDIAGASTDPMQAEVDNVYNDDDMLDDDTTHQIDNSNDLRDANMDSYEDDGNGEDFVVQTHDEEFLYDEEEAEPANMTEEDTISAEILENVPQTANNDDRPDFAEEEEGKSETEDYVNNTDTIDGNEINADHLHKQISGSSSDVPEIPPVRTDSKSGPVAEIQVVDFATQSVAEENNHSPTEHETDQAEANTELEADTGVPDHQDTGSKYEEEEEPQPLPTEMIPANTRQEQIEFIDTVKEPTVVESEQTANRSLELLHPVTIVYLDQEMSLFPPMVDDASATFFVSDQALAYEPIDKLLASCREILGESLEHDDELVLDVSALGLHICEDSKYASQITLSQIVETYLTLSRNENITDIEPLYCSLSSRVCLASQYAYLAACATEGKPYSEIVAEYADSPVHETASFTEEEVSQSYKSEDLAGTEDNRNEDSTLETGQTTGDHPDEINKTSVRDVREPQSSSANALNAVDQTNERDNVTADTQHADPRSDIDSGLTNDSTRELQNGAAPESAVTELHSEGIDGESKPEEQAEDSTEQDYEPADFQDDASVSSHTVEGENMIEPDNTQNLDFNDAAETDTHQDEDAQPDGPDELDNYDYAEDLFKEENEYDADPKGPHHVEAPGTDRDPIGDIEDENGSQPYPLNDDDTEYDELTLNEVVGDDEDYPGTDENTDELDILEVSDVTVGQPVTPSKLNGSKRKMLDQDDDDLDILNTSTPEPKRTRAS